MFLNKFLAQFYNGLEIAARLFTLLDLQRIVVDWYVEMLDGFFTIRIV